MQRNIIKTVIIQFMACYTVLTLIFAAGSALEGNGIYSNQIIKLAALSALCAAITYIRLIVDEKQWMLRLSFLIKRLMFAPLYLIATLVILLNLGKPFECSFHDGLIICIIFLAAFILTLIITYPRMKKQEQIYMKALSDYQNRLDKDVKGTEE